MTSRVLLCPFPAGKRKALCTAAGAFRSKTMRDMPGISCPWRMSEIRASGGVCVAPVCHENLGKSITRRYGLPKVKARKSTVLSMSTTRRVLPGCVPKRRDFMSKAQAGVLQINKRYKEKMAQRLLWVVI